MSTTLLTNAPFATGSEIGTGYVFETSYGVLPQNPAFQMMRVTGGPGLKTNKVVVTSDEIQPDRNVRDEIQVGQDVAGSFPTELTYGTFDDWFEALLCGTWTNNVVKNGLARRSMSIFQNYVPGGTSIAEHIFLGNKLSSAAFSVQARQKITATWNLMGQREIDDPTVLSAATYVQPTTTPVLTASGSVGSLTLTGQGGAFASAPVRSIDFNVDNKMYMRPEVGNLYTDEPGEGRFDVAGNVEVYFRDNAIYAAALAHQNAALSFTVGPAAGQRYLFNFPNIKLGSMDLSMPGNDQDVMLKIPVRALYDAASGASMSITRNY